MLLLVLLKLTNPHLKFWLGFESVQKIHGHHDEMINKEKVVKLEMNE
jgi:hypothetical protein